MHSTAVHSSFDGALTLRDKITPRKSRGRMVCELSSSPVNKIACVFLVGSTVKNFCHSYGIALGKADDVSDLEFVLPGE